MLSIGIVACRGRRRPTAGHKTRWSASATRSTASWSCSRARARWRSARRRSAVKVKWTEFPAGPQLLEALNVGAIDFGAAGEAPPIFAQAAGAPIWSTSPTSRRRRRARRSWCRRTRRSRRVADLKGKKVALNKGSNVHYLLVKALEKAGLEYADIAAGLPGAGRCARRLRARRGRRLGDLGSVPGRGRKRPSARACWPTAPASSPTTSSTWRRADVRSKRTRRWSTPCSTELRRGRRLGARPTATRWPSS